MSILSRRWVHREDVKGYRSLQLAAAGRWYPACALARAGVVRMNRCSVCGREIPETRTVCETCGSWAAEPAVPAESAESAPEQQPLPDLHTPYASAKIAHFPTPENAAPKPVAPVTPVTPVVPFAPATEPVEPTAAPASAAPPVPAPSANPSHAAPAAAAKPKTGIKLPAIKLPAIKLDAPAALAQLKGRRGVIAGLGVAAALAIAVLVARPAPPAETAPTTAAVTPKPEPAVPKPSPVPQVGSASPARSGETAAGLDVKWAVNSKRWGATQKKSIALELPALNRVPVWMRHVTPMLVVRCVAKQTEAFVFTESPIAMEPDTPDHTVRLTFDGEPQKSELWPDSVEHDSLFAPDGAAFLRRLMTAQTLQFGFTPHNSTPVVVEFQVNGLRSLIEPAAKDCGSK
jgi:hypothetical protein